MLLKDIQDPLIIRVGIAAGQAKEDDAGRSRQSPPEGQCPEILVACDDQPVLLGRPCEDRVDSFTETIS